MSPGTVRGTSADTGISVAAGAGAGEDVDDGGEVNGGGGGMGNIGAGGSAACRRAVENATRIQTKPGRHKSRGENFMTASVRPENPPKAIPNSFRLFAHRSSRGGRLRPALLMKWETTTTRKPIAKSVCAITKARPRLVAGAMSPKPTVVVVVVLK